VGHSYSSIRALHCLTVEFISFGSPFLDDPDGLRSRHEGRLRRPKLSLSHRNRFEDTTEPPTSALQDLTHPQHRLPDPSTTAFYTHPTYTPPWYALRLVQLPLVVPIFVINFHLPLIDSDLLCRTTPSSRRRTRSCGEILHQNTVLRSLCILHDPVVGFLLGGCEDLGGKDATLECGGCHGSKWRRYPPTRN
jgi:hypothetical protein